MKIAISGANGYIGGNLVQMLKQAGHELIVLNRQELYSSERLKEKLSGTDAVVHLAGAPILCRWTPENKEKILRSRTVSTQHIVEALHALSENNRPHTFISASAIGIYTVNQEHTESSTSFSKDFVGKVVRQWENSSAELPASVRRVIFRIGLVLGKESKTMKQMLPLFRLGLGGRLGSGKQPFPFVHIQDVVQAVILAAGNTDIHGIYNLVAPQNCTNQQLTHELAKALHRPAVFAVPEFALKLMYGEAASLLLQSPVVYPERLLNSGFKFSFPDLQSCLAEITS